MDQTQRHRGVLAHSNEGARHAAQRLSGGHARSSKLRCGFTLALSAALAASFSSAMPALAHASELQISNEVIEQAKSALNGTGASPNSYATQSATTKAASKSKLPSSYDLRDPNGDGNQNDSVVTSVKNQMPWGTCWGFAAIAACETSILSKAAKEGKSDEVQDLDLSELQLSWSAYKEDGAPASAVGEAQAGEGYHSESDNPNYGLDMGGQPGWAASIFAAGIGPVYEELAPYQNKSGRYKCMVTPAGSTRYTTKNLTDEQIELYKASGATVQKLYYSGNYKDDNGKTQYTDWSVDESIWNSSSFEFENANILPDTVVWDESTGAYQGIDDRAVEAIKSEIHEGRAVSCAFCSDSGLYRYTNESTWAHYTYDESEEADHAVTIVGWDDGYSASNFKNAEGKKPEGDGAWLVKNNWGAETESFPNNQEENPFGILDEDGKHTGYFWLSYYDRSICQLESFDFDLNTYSDGEEYVIDQYDYMPQNSLVVIPDTETASSANIYNADGDMILRSLATEVARPNSTVTYEVYLLDDDAKTPVDGKKVCTTKASYDYSGYHRITLDKADWIAMREGQRYAVVTTQKCNDDGLYYTCAGQNYGKATDAEIAAYAESVPKTVKNEFYTDYYNQQLDLYVDEGLSEVEAMSKATNDANAYIELESTKTAMAAEVATKIKEFKTSYFVAKVNKGESFTNSAACLKKSQSAVWYDWSRLANSKAMAATGAVVDNLPIKAYGELNEWASVEQLTKLDTQLAAAKKLLKNAVVSENGTGLTKAQAWIAQSDYDKLKAGVETAQALMEQAGEDYKTTLSNTTPTPDEAAAAINALAITTHTGDAMAANTIKAVKGKLTVKKGKTAKLAIKKAQGKVTVTCSNKKVKASYKSGKLVVKGKKKGKAVIKVKAAGNSVYNAGTATIKVTVK